MKILVIKTADFIENALAKKLLKQENEIVEIDSINNYYDLGLKYAKLNRLCMSQSSIKKNKIVKFIIYTKHKFGKVAEKIWSLCKMEMHKVLIQAQVTWQITLIIIPALKYMMELMSLSDSIKYLMASTNQ